MTVLNGFAPPSVSKVLSYPPNFVPSAASNIIFNNGCEHIKTIDERAIIFIILGDQASSLTIKYTGIIINADVCIVYIANTTTK